MKTLLILPSLLGLILCHALDIKGQTFQRTYGTSLSQTGTCIQNTPDGNYIISAIAAGVGAGSNDFLLMKVNTAGTILWSKTYGGSLGESPYYVEVCQDGGYILTGSTGSYGQGSADVFLVKTASDGALQWARTVGGSATDVGWFVKQANDGSYYVSGYTTSFAGPSFNGYFLKFDTGGNLLWSKVFNGTGGDLFYGMNKTKDGGMVLTGSTSTKSFGSSDIWLVRTDSNGDTLWTSIYGKITEDAGWAVIETSDGGFAVTGDMHKDTVTPGAHNTLLLKTNSAGNMQWAHLYGSNPGSEVGYDLRQTTDKGYVVLGNTNVYGNGSKDIFLFRTDSVGGFEWAKTYGSSMQDDSWQMRPLSNGGNMIIAATENFSANGVWDIYLLTTDSLGDAACVTDTVTPEVFTPFLQQRKGFTIISGGVQGNPTPVVNTVTLSTSDPCTFVAVDEQGRPVEAMVYPNPFSDRTVIQFTYATSIELYDSFGRIVHAWRIEPGTTETEIVRGDLPSGIYYYKLTSERGPIISGKLIVE